MQNITVIGIGKLGLGFALLLEKAGYNVMGVDISQPYVDAINQKSPKFEEPQYNELLQNAKNFEATTNLQQGLNHSELIFIIVQTPNGGGTKFYDHTILSNLLEKINTYRPENKHFVIGCTVMPKYIDTIATLIMKDCPSCSINYNPEFVAQGDIVRGFSKPDIILVGSHSQEIRPLMTDIYTRMTESPPIFCFMTPLEAEIVKISLNGFITTKLSFANMISDLCDELGAHKQTVLHAIGSDSRIGRKYFNPGLSFGGPCFPRDTKALRQLMEQNNIRAELLEATTSYNNEHNRIYAEKVANNPSPEILAQLKCEQLTSDTYILQNVCYKEDSTIPIIEESAKLKIAEQLVKTHKKQIIIKDTANIIAEVKKEYGTLFDYEVILP
jgi:nucleotide sugar dehydrogenase